MQHNNLVKKIVLAALTETPNRTVTLNVCNTDCNLQADVRSNFAYTTVVIRYQHWPDINEDN